MKNKTNLIFKVLMAIFAVYALFCLVVYIRPELFLYNPNSQRPNLNKIKSEVYNPQEVVYKSADGTELFGWYTPPVSENYTVVFMHGNSDNIESFYKKLIPFAEAGYGTFIGEYRGFGGIKGKISQKNLEDDALAMINYLRTLNYDNDNLIIYGMSLGSHMAINTIYQLQKDGNFKGLILEVPFDSLENVVKDRVKVLLPLDIILQDKYDNLEMIGQIKTPMLFTVAENDKVVPVERAKNLYKNAPENKLMIEYPNAEHHNLYDYKNYEVMLKWLR